MKAAVYTRYGPPEVVRFAEVDRPTAGERELLVMVHGAIVAPVD